LGTTIETGATRFASMMVDTPWAADLMGAGLEAIPIVGEYATGIGEIKLAYDGLSYFEATAGCALGILH